MPNVRCPLLIGRKEIISRILALTNQYLFKTGKIIVYTHYDTSSIRQSRK
jgi:hypothetical protein